MGALVAVLLCCVPAAVAQAAAPQVRAPEAIVIDARTGGVLFAKHADDRHAIASTTKLMTALLTLQSTKPDQVFRAVPYAALAAESTLGLQAGERMTVHDLLRALLLESANDAAATLAKGVSGSSPAFVDRMNAEARRLGLDHTSYANPIGLDDPDNYSTAHDLALLARKLMRDRTFASIVDLPSATLESGSHPRTVLNRNLLVRSYPFVNGVKTGHTRDAGYVLVGAGERNGAEVISVVFGEPSEAARDTETLRLLRYGLSRFRRVHVAIPSRTLDLVPVNYFSSVHIPLRAQRNVYLTVPRGAVVRTHLKLPFPLHLTGPLPRGSAVGEVVTVVDGRRASRIPLVTAEAVPAAGFWRRWAIRAGRTRPTITLGVLGVALLGALQLRGPLLRRFRGRGQRR